MTASLLETGAERIAATFKLRFGTPAILVASPGRVNLIGEHTDYNMGFVLPAAVDRTIWIAASPRKDRVCLFNSADLGVSFVTSLDQIVQADVKWANYLLGIYAEMAASGKKPMGVNCVFGGDVPIGSGMSSSAALECGFAFAINELFDLGYERVSLARLGQASENHFVGVGCGIMDPFASVMGREGKLIRLDCRDLSFEYVPFDRKDVRIVVCDTQVRRSLAGSEYNVRRAQCEAGVAVLAAANPRVKSLRDATMDMLEEAKSALDPLVFRRCAYVVQENERVLNGCSVLERDDFGAFGQLMNLSHQGLRDDYQVSCQELDILATAAQAIPGVLGARMMGAGFGGCTINLVEEAALDEFQERMALAFREGLRKDPVIHVCRLTAGTRTISLEP